MTYEVVREAAIQRRTGEGGDDSDEWETVYEYVTATESDSDPDLEREEEEHEADVPPRRIVRVASADSSQS
jgi:hypothetical protein